MKEYVGFDVSKEETSFCVMDEAGAAYPQTEQPQKGLRGAGP